MVIKFETQIPTANFAIKSTCYDPERAPTGCIEMVPDKKIPQMRIMKMGQHSLNPCINEFQCETCPVEKEFFEDMRLVIAGFRSN